MKKHTVVLKHNKKTLIAYLKENMQFSSRKTKSLLRHGAIKLNGKKAYGDSMVKDGDVLFISKEEKHGDNIFPQNMSLSILYEDDYLMALDKPPFVSMHPTGNNNKDTLANGVRYYFNTKKLMNQ